MMLSLLVLVSADIPVHCLIADFAGEWELELSPVVSETSSAADVPDFAQGGIANDFCYLPHPNNNPRNLQLDLAAQLEKDGLAMTKVSVQLSQNITVRGDASEHMAARYGDTAATWTTTYDEGWELRMGPAKRFFALAKYACAPGADSCGEVGAGEDGEGKTEGYVSHCGQTLVGWYHTPEGKGCFVGTKTVDAGKVHALVLLERKAKVTVGSSVPVYTAYHHANFAVASLGRHYSSMLELHRGGASKSFRTTRRAGSIRRVRAAADEMHLRDQCEGDDVAMAAKIKEMETADPIFDWRTQFGGAWNTPVVDQGGCGSCYAIAMTYTLQSRANIMRLQEMQNRSLVTADGKGAPAAAELSAHSVLSCSYYNQGCEGGYPYLVGKHAQEFGIPAESCQAYNGNARNGKPDACNQECYQDSDNVVFAENYNYVGGFYGVCGQERMMRSLRAHGPLAIAIEVPQPFEGASENHVAGFNENGSEDGRPQNLRDENEGAFPADHHRQNPQPAVKLLEAKWGLNDSNGCKAGSLTDAKITAALETAFPGAFVSRAPGRFALNSDDLEAGNATETYEKAVSTLASSVGVSTSCIHLTLVDGTMNGWEYTNHAITLIGWGENKVIQNGKESTQKYWIIRNSWGEYFGNEGYAYVLRGDNYGGIESQAVDVQVDKTRGAMKKWLSNMQKQGGSLAEIRRHVVVGADGSLSA